MTDTFQVGDVVRLKSGGPKMTVTVIGDIYGTPTIWCVWFVSTKQETGSFPPNAIEPAIEEPVGNLQTRANTGRRDRF